MPGREIVVSYLYFPPLTADQINAGIECDQGGARQIPVLLQRQFPRWVVNTWRLLMYVGLVTIVYLAFRALLAFVL